jgi:RNA polymerase sigma factor (TIGR02999 family)
MSDVTQILNAIAGGDAQAADQLLPLVYEELRQLAAQKLAQEKPGQTLQATALVHEAYLRLVASGDASAPREQNWNSLGHFFAAAAQAMRRILVDSARSKRRHKRGGDRARIDFDALEIPAPQTPRRSSGPGRSLDTTRRGGSAVRRTRPAPLFRGPHHRASS